MLLDGLKFLLYVTCYHLKKDGCWYSSANLLFIPVSEKTTFSTKKKKTCSQENVELYCVWNVLVSVEQYLLSQYDPHPRNAPVELGVGNIHLC